MSSLTIIGLFSVGLVVLTAVILGVITSVINAFAAVSILLASAVIMLGYSRRTRP